MNTNYSRLKVTSLIIYRKVSNAIRYSVINLIFSFLTWPCLEKTKCTEMVPRNIQSLLALKIIPRINEMFVHHAHSLSENLSLDTKRIKVSNILVYHWNKFLKFVYKINMHNYRTVLFIFLL